MTIPATYEFEGQHLTVAQILPLLKAAHVVISEDTVRLRLKRGQSTIAEMRRPLAPVNRAWNARAFGRGHTA